MKKEQYKKIAKLIRSNEVYDVYDHPVLDHLNLSMTELHPGKETSGHSHEGIDEIYFFVLGNGRIQIGENSQDCEAGEVYTIPGGAFHKVFNTSDKELIFWCVFEKYGDRK